MTGKRNLNKELCDLPRRVEVSFLIPGVGSTKEQYDLGRAEHLLAWSMNERLTRAVQTGVRVVEYVKVPRWMAKHANRSRLGMRRYINEKVGAARTRISRAAKDKG